MDPVSESAAGRCEFCDARHLGSQLFQPRVNHGVTLIVIRILRKIDSCLKEDTQIGNV